MKKKISILMLVLGLSSLSYSVDFSFKDYKPNTSSDYVITNKKISSKFDLPVFNSDNSSADRKINRALESFKETYSKIGNTVSYEVLTDNASVVSVLFKVENDEETSYYPYNFLCSTGEVLQLQDLFLSGFEGALNGVIKDKIGQFGLTLSKNYKGATGKSKFILKNDGIELVFNGDEGTTFGDKIIFVPFKLVELVGILK